MTRGAAPAGHGQEAEAGSGAALLAEATAAIALAGGPAARLAGPARLARLGGLGTLARLHDRARAAGTPYPRAMLELLDIRWRVAEGGAEIPASGPLLVTATHPTGAMDGLILADILDARRPDRRTLGNAMVARIPDLAARQIPVDPVARRGNGPAMIAALGHLRAGGCLATFPAGTVAHFRLRAGGVAEAPWHPGVLRLAALAGAPVLEIRIAARASRLWRLLAGVSRTARTALLPRELLAQCGARPVLHLSLHPPPER